MSNEKYTQRLLPDSVYDQQAKMAENCVPLSAINTPPESSNDSVPFQHYSKIKRQYRNESTAKSSSRVTEIRR